MYNGGGEDLKSSELLKHKKVAIYIILTLILALSFYVRFQTFNLPRNSGDQSFFVALAYKLDRYGIEEYTLRGIKKVTVEKDKAAYYYHADSEDEKGDILKGLEKIGITYYDEPLYHNPPLFSYLLIASHKLITPKNPYSLIYYFDSKSKVKNFYIHQLYAALVPALSSLLLIFFTYLLGRKLFSDLVGLVACLILSFNPVELVASNKVWADDTTALLVIVTIYLFLLAEERDSLILSVASGFFGGLAFLTKQNGGFVALVIVLYKLYLLKSEIKRNLLKIFDPKLILFGVTMTLIVSPWFFLIFKTYGVLYYVPTQIGKMATEWAFAVSRHWYTYLFGIPYLMPIFALSYPMIILSLKNQKKEGILLSIWILVYLAIFSFYVLGKEHRYMLSAYPAIAILSSKLLEDLRGEFSLLFERVRLPSSTSYILLILLVFYFSKNAYELGMKIVLSRLDIISIPF